MEVFVFFAVAVVLTLVVLFVLGMSKIFATYTKLEALFVRLTAVEAELHQLNQQLTKERTAAGVLPEVNAVENPLENAEVVPVVDKGENPKAAVLDDVPVEVIRAQTEQAMEENTLAEQALSAAITAASLDVEADAPTIPPRIRKKSAIERFFSDNILTKIGVITFVLGIAFFVKYAIDQEWINEVGRVGIGILTGGVMIGIAHRLRREFDVFSSLLVGGGISVFYITITLAFREYELFSQTVAFVILILITCFSVAISLLYNRRELAIFSLLGGFLAPLLVSTGTGNYLVLFSYILMLNSGMCYLSFRKNWIVIGYVAFVLTAFFIGAWMVNGFVDQYLGGAVFAALFFVQFYIVALVNTSKDNKIAAQIILIILNNAVFLGVYFSLFENYPGLNVKGLIAIVFALANAGVLMYLWKKRKINSLYLYAVMGIVVSLITLAIPMQLNGHYITMFWSVEIVVLLVLYFKSKLRVFYTGFLVVSALAVVSYLLDVGTIDQLQQSTLIFNPLFVTGLVVFTSFFIAYIWMKKQGLKSKALRYFPVVLKVLAFAVPFLELTKEIHFLETSTPIGNFEQLAVVVYSVCYAAILFSISAKSKLNYVINWCFIGFATLLLGSFSNFFRSEVFVEGVLNLQYFLVVFIAVPALVVLLMQLYKNPNYEISSKWIRWMLAVASLILLCIYIDHTTVLFKGGSVPMSYPEYNAILETAHIIVYPIIWAGVALFLTYLGIVRQRVFLRQIAMALLGITIVKFYVLDVWSMSEGGKVLSFVLLGIIILIVAFLMNRIKGLLVEGDKDPADGDSSNAMSE
ncbi:DUF2339 domain-containing protein [Flavobacterium sp. JP2137]|uniref:DUF2339 domain-containing protein n=1 Tax=Flavobacterium sp. JP2137 TaxID=3414510 RepID=UPI003D2FFCA1